MVDNFVGYATTTNIYCGFATWTGLCRSVVRWSYQMPHELVEGTHEQSPFVV